MTYIRGSDVEAGMMIRFLGTPHLIVSMEPYRHPAIDAPARIAHGEDGWTMTIFDGDLVEVVA